MIKMALSQNTRRKALDAFQDMDTEKLLNIISQNKQAIPDYYQKSLAQALAHDERDFKAWATPDSQEHSDAVKAMSRTGGPSEKAQTLNLLKHYASKTTDTPKYGRVGADRISKDSNHASEIVGSALKSGDNLRVAQPHLNMNSKSKAETLLETINTAGDAGGGDNDTGGSGGYGF